MSATQSIDKTLQSIFSGGSWYEAQQTIKTKYHRYRARKLYKEGYEILQEGAIRQFQNRQITCGVELALLLVKAYNDDKAEAEDDKLSGLSKIVESFPLPTDEEVDGGSHLTELSRFIASAYKWLRRQGAEWEAQSLNDSYAKYIFRAYVWQEVGKACLYFSRGRDAQAFAELLQQYMEVVADQERDLVLARAYLQVLATGQDHNKMTRLSHAMAVVKAVRDKAALPDSPLLHFLDLLSQALELKSHDLFLLLKQQYQPSVARDASLEPYLAKTESLFFNVNNSGGGLLSSLMRVLNADEDD